MGIAAQRTVDDLPVLAELDRPEWGTDFSWVSSDLFAREYQGLMRASWGDLVVYRNADVNDLRSDPRVSHQTLEAMADYFQDPEDPRGSGTERFLAINLFSQRQPEHRPFKQWLARPLGAKKIAEYHEDIAALARSLVADGAERGQVDFLGDISKPLVAGFWSRTLGLTLDEAKRVVDLAGAFETPAFKVAPCEQDVKDANRAGHEYMDALSAAIERGLKSGDVPMLAGLAQDYAEAGALGRAEDIAERWASTLLDGFHTLGAVTANVVYAALQAGARDFRPAASDPDYAKNVCLEGLRLHPAVIFNLRQATEDFVFEETFIPKDTNIALMWLFASRDPDVFPDPDAYRLERPNRTRQYAFGGGPFICPGRHVADFLCQILITELGRAAVRLELAGDAAWLPGSIVHELIAMPVAVSRS